MTAAPYVVGIGAANADLHGRGRADIVLRDSNPGEIRFSPGGVTRNILENLSRMGDRTVLISAVGEDPGGEQVLAASRAAGIDTSRVLRCPGEMSSTYLAILDAGGDMYLALSDMRILEHVDPELLEGERELIRSAAALVCDGCLSPETLEWIVSSAPENVPRFVDPVSTAYAARLRPFAHRFHCLKPNVLELSALTGRELRSDADMEAAAGALLDRGAGCVVVSLGRRGCYWADREGKRFYRRLAPVEHMTDATGAGDAFMAGLVHARLHGFTPAAAADWALAAGVVAVTSAGTVSPGMSAPLIETILKEDKKHERKQDNESLSGDPAGGP